MNPSHLPHAHSPKQVKSWIVNSKEVLWNTQPHQLPLQQAHCFKMPSSFFQKCQSQNRNGWKWKCISQQEEDKHKLCLSQPISVTQSRLGLANWGFSQVNPQFPASQVYKLQDRCQFTFQQHGCVPPLLFEAVFRSFSCYWNQKFPQCTD